jgi:putative ABC transport system permease protein
LLIRYEGNPRDIVANVEKLWKQHSPNEPFEYAFMDESFDELFRAEQRMGNIFSIFSGLAIFIASLGLFALAAFTSEQRTKEIGIMKVLGCFIFDIKKLFLLTFKYLHTILVLCVA